MEIRKTRTWNTLIINLYQQNNIIIIQQFYVTRISYLSPTIWICSSRIQGLWLQIHTMKFATLAFFDHLKVICIWNIINLLQWSQRFLASGETSTVGRQTYSVICKVADYLFCFIHQSENVLCTELFLNGTVSSQ